MIQENDYSITRLFHYKTIPLQDYFITRLSITRLFHSKTIPFQDYSIARLFHYNTIPLQDYCNGIVVILDQSLISIYKYVDSFCRRFAAPRDKVVRKSTFEYRRLSTFFVIVQASYFPKICCFDQRVTEISLGDKVCKLN